MFGKSFALTFKRSRVSAAVVAGVLLLTGAMAFSQVEEFALYNFGSAAFDGSYPGASLVEGSTGKSVYGTTAYGGTTGNGIVFQLTSPPVFGPWLETILYNFTGGSDGGNPMSALVFDAAGNLYGTTTTGGDFGSGTVFELTPPVNQGSPWTEITLHSFSAKEGAPISGVLVDSQGKVYGTTTNHNANGVVSPAEVFKLSPPSSGTGPWTEQILFRFTEHSNADSLIGGLVFDTKGNLYGAALNSPTGSGFVFQLAPPASQGAPWTETVIYTFTNSTDGGFPYSGLIIDSLGQLYGTTAAGGKASGFNGRGVVYQLVPPTQTGGAWTENVIYTFQGSTDGGVPRGNLAFDTKGNLYGMTNQGGDQTCSCGTVFELAAPVSGTWTFTALHAFTAGSDGAQSPRSYGGVIFHTGVGIILGTTWGGGTVDYRGTFWKVVPNP